MTEDSKKTSISDNDLLRLHMEGDAQAFPTLIKRYRNELYNFLAKFTYDAELAEDVFQEAFLQLHLSAASFDMSRRLKPWLFTIAANKARDAMRSRYRRQAASLDATIPGGSEGEDSFVDLMPSKIPTPDETLLNLEARKAVQTIISRMPDKLRMVLLLSYFHGFQYSQIAEMLDVPLGTVKSRLHSAIKYFAQKWKAVSEDTKA